MGTISGTPHVHLGGRREKRLIGMRDRSMVWRNRRGRMKVVYDSKEDEQR